MRFWKKLDVVRAERFEDEFTKITITRRNIQSLGISTFLRWTNTRQYHSTGYRATQFELMHITTMYMCLLLLTRISKMFDLEPYCMSRIKMHYELTFFLRDRIIFERYLVINSTMWSFWKYFRLNEMCSKFKNIWTQILYL